MKIRVGSDDRVLGTIEGGPDGPFRFDGDEPALRELAEFYANRLADMVEAGDRPDADLTAEGVLRHMADRMNGRTWATIEGPDGEAEELADQPAVPRDEVALAGPDGVKAAKLLGAAKDSGTRTLYYLCRRAVARLLDNPDAKHLFDADELVALADQLAAVNATANLLGRARVRERAEQAEQRRMGFAFADADSFVAFADPPPPLAPQQAIDYFQTLVPSLSVTPERFGPLLRREAFTMAARTDEVMLARVKDIIAEALTTGDVTNRTAQIETILEQAGVAPRNPQYGEAVFRSNMMDSFNVGAQEELQTPEMQAEFPAWLYLSITDDRARPTHAARNDKLYPNTVAFTAVRGTEAKDAINCRCSFRPVHRYELEDMRKAGRDVETSW